MKRIPRHDPRKDAQCEPPASGAQELDGFVELGMKRQALRLARRTLMNAPMTAGAFSAAMSAVLTLADRTKKWSPLVESAYARLSKRSRRSVHFWMLSFHCSHGNYEAARQFIPRRFGGNFGLSEMAFAWDTWMALGIMDKVEELARRLPRALKVARHPLMRAQLRRCLAEYHARMGNWDKAARFWESVTSNETLSQNAVIGIVELDVASALRTIRHGFRLIQEFNKNFDPEAEIIVPGNDQAIQRDAAKEYERLQKILERIVPNQRQEELGFE